MAILRFAVSLWLVCLCCFSLQAQSEEALVRFEVKLDQTAIWLGNLLEYRIRLYHSEEVEIIRDNLKAGDIHLDPFTLLDMAVGPLRTEQGQGLQIIFHLTVLERSAGELIIPSLNVYYATRQAGSLGKGSEIETHTLVIPERKVGLRSTLTSDSRDIRDFLGVRSTSWMARLMWIPGWFVIGLFAVQGARWSLIKYREMAGGAQRIDKKTVEQRALVALNSLAPMAGGEQLPQRCLEIIQIVQGAIADLVEVEEVTALTPQELREELIRRNTGEPVSDQVFKVFEECEALRYGSLASTDGGRDLSELIGSCREVISQLARL